MELYAASLFSKKAYSIAGGAIALALVLSACGPALPDHEYESVTGEAETGEPAMAESNVTAELYAETLPGEAPAAEASSEEVGPAETVASSDTEEITEAFQGFLDIMAGRESISRIETGANGYVYLLGGGQLSVTDAGGKEIWCSKSSWWVDDFRLGDVDGDGAEDFLFSLWKSYRFGEAHPARMENDDETVRNHLFLYTVLQDTGRSGTVQPDTARSGTNQPDTARSGTIQSGWVKSVWGSSDLPRPIYSFELDPSGRVTPVSSGMLLKTFEGEYRDGFVRTEPVEHNYAWQGWGFVPLD